MAGYLLIESRDPVESHDVTNFYDLAAGLAGPDTPVTLFLVQNGVFPARRSAHSAAALAAVTRAGVEVLADEFSLRERGIPSEQLTARVSAAPLDVVIDRLAEGCKALWH
jgi:intracellular sulfur oxidation DsrE/DsrF family protein